MILVSQKLQFIESVFGKGNLAKNEQNFDVRCPICDPKDKSKRKLSIHVDTTMVHCWTCGFSAKTLAPLIKKFGTREQLNEYCTKIHPYAVVPQENEKQIVKLPSDFELLVLSNSQLPNAKAVRRYLEIRNVSEEDLWFYKIGISKEFRWARRAIIPSFDRQGKLNYFSARAVDKDAYLRYDTPEGNKDDVIFNELNIDWHKRLVLCEGPFDMLKCGENVVPLMGNSLSENSLLFCTIIANETPVALALDSTEISKMEKYAKKLSEYNVDVLIVDVSPYKDPGEMHKDEFQLKLNSAKKVSWKESILKNLNKASRVSLKI